MDQFANTSQERTAALKKIFPVLRLITSQLEMIREIIRKYGYQVQTSIGRVLSENPLQPTAQ